MCSADAVHFHAEPGFVVMQQLDERGEGAGHERVNLRDASGQVAALKLAAEVDLQVVDEDLLESGVVHGLLHIVDALLTGVAVPDLQERGSG